ncbi:MAG: sulfite exporter TauE/SafE family protein [Propionibacteriaceae bacterium]|nr:sulfite exporter TauE/SafE family protein [Propionibacteriaceae bacterium]
MLTVDVWAWLFLAALALIIGVSKTSIAGLAALAVAGFAVVLPAKESTAAVLFLLITGDIVAVAIYHHAADWALLKKLLPSVVPGIVIGTVFMRFVSDQVLVICVAASLFIAVGLQIGLRVRESHGVGGAEPPGTPTPEARWPAISAGVAAGFTTMVANAAGAVMSLYLLAVKADKVRFVATGAWFFFLVNVTKVPFSIGLGLVHVHTLVLLATLIPAVLVGTWLGRRFLKLLNQHVFEWATIASSALSAVILLLKGVL